MMESLEKTASKINDSDHSLMMILCGEHDSCQMILVMPIFIVSSKHVSQICIFCRGPTHVVENYPYRSNRVSVFMIEPIFGTTQPAISVSSQIPMTQVLVIPCEPYRHNHVQQSQFLKVTFGFFECGKVFKGFQQLHRE